MKLSRFTQLTLTKLNTFEEEDLKLFSAINKPVNIGDIEVDEINFEFDDKLVLENLLNNLDNDAECGILIYELFSSLEKMTLLDPGFWSLLSLDAFWSYTFVKYFEGRDNLKSVFESNVLLTNSNYMNLFNNSISKLYWITAMTVSGDEDKYGLTRFVFDNPFLIDNLFKMEIMLNKHLNKVIIRQIMLINDFDLSFSKTDVAFLEYLCEQITIKTAYNCFDYCSDEEFGEFVMSVVEDYKNII